MSVTEILCQSECEWHTVNGDDDIHFCAGFQSYFPSTIHECVVDANLSVQISAP